MREILPLLLLLAPAGPALAHSHDAHCPAQAREITERLSREAEAPLDADELAIAHRAALAACREQAGQEVARAEESQSGVARFFSGLFSMDEPPAKKRAGKYRYIEKD